MTRRLDPNERIVWNRVARTVAPRRRPHGPQAAKPLPARPGETREDFGAMMRLPALQTAKSDPTGPVPANTDRPVRRGRVEIDARVDLHGMTREQARAALATALMRTAKRSGRCLLVITGKGPRLEGVLRSSLPGWLNAPDLRPFVASLAPAHVRHGGSGAWYVFLRSD